MSDDYLAEVMRQAIEDCHAKLAEATKRQQRAQRLVEVEDREIGLWMKRLKDIDAALAKHEAKA